MESISRLPAFRRLALRCFELITENTQAKAPGFREPLRHCASGPASNRWRLGGSAAVSPSRVEKRHFYPNCLVRNQEMSGIRRRIRDLFPSSGPEADITDSPVTAPSSQANPCALRGNAEALQSILRILVTRDELQLSAIIGDRLGPVAELFVDLRPALKIIGSRLHCHRLLGIGQALRVLALPMIGPGSMTVGPGQSVGTVVTWRLDYCGAARNSLIVRKGVARAPEPLLLRKRPGRQRDEH